MRFCDISMCVYFLTPLFEGLRTDSVIGNTTIGQVLCGSFCHGTYVQGAQCTFPFRKSSNILRSADTLFFCFRWLHWRVRRSFPWHVGPLTPLHLVGAAPRFRGGRTRRASAPKARLWTSYSLHGWRWKQSEEKPVPLFKLLLVGNTPCF